MLVEYPKPSDNKIANVGSIHILLIHAATGFDESRKQKDVVVRIGDGSVSQEEYAEVISDCLIRDVLFVRVHFLPQVH